MDKLLEFMPDELKIRCGRFCGDCDSTAYAYKFTVVFLGVVVLLGVKLPVLLLLTAHGVLRGFKNLGRVLS